MNNGKLTVMALLISIGMLPTLAHADLNLATDYDPITNFNTHPGQPVDYSTGTYGYSFTVGASPLRVTTLATAYAGAQGQVRIYVSGSTTDVATAFITGAQVDNSQHGNPYGYTDITPVILSANTTYDIVWDNTIYGQAFSPDEPGYSYNSDVTFGSGISSYTPGEHPTTDQVGEGAYFGPSFEAFITPEPGIYALLASSILTGSALLRRRKQSCKSA